MIQRWHWIGRLLASGCLVLSGCSSSSQPGSVQLDPIDVSFRLDVSRLLPVLPGTSVQVILDTATETRSSSLIPVSDTEDVLPRVLFEDVAAGPATLQCFTLVQGQIRDDLSGPLLLLTLVPGTNDVTLDCFTPIPTPTLTPTSTPTSPLTPTPAAPPTLEPTPTSVPSPTPLPTPTSPPSPTPDETPTPVPSPSPSPTPLPISTPGVFNFGFAATTISEEDEEILRIPVLRQFDTNGEAQVTYTIAGTASLGSDYVISPRSSEGSFGVLDFTDGQSVHFIEIQSIQDVEIEVNETIDLQLVSATGDATIGLRDQFGVTIIDDDEGASEPGVFQFEMPSDPDVFEDGTSTQIRVVRAQGSDGDVEVVFTIAGSAEKTVDYVILDPSLSNGIGTLTFADQQTEAFITLAPLVDSLTEDPETIEFELSSVSAGSIGSPSQVTLTLLDVPATMPTLNCSAGLISADSGSFSALLAIERVNTTAPIQLSDVNIASQFPDSVITFMPELIVDPSPTVNATLSVLTSSPTFETTVQVKANTTPTEEEEEASCFIDIPIDPGGGEPGSEG